MTDILRDIHTALQCALPGAIVTLTDESAQHAGHANAGPGIYHIAIHIACDHLAQQRAIDAHRQVYRIITPWMPRPLHAARIEIKTLDS